MGYRTKKKKNHISGEERVEYDQQSGPKHLYYT